MMVVSGPSGYGKSVAAAWAKARHRAYYLQLDDFVTKKAC
jgi:ATP/maltotriose-dependent transcriptional regulator MalT